MTQDPTCPLVDTHCHLDFPEFDPDRDQVIERARQAGVIYLVNIGSSLESSERSVALAAHYPCVYATVGIHPHDADSVTASMLASIRQLAQQKKVVAVGEIGLDYFKNYSDPKNQLPLFEQLTSLAKDLHLPLVIHSRQAAEDTVKVLRSAGSYKAVVHCFSGDEKFLDACLGLGFYISFTCNLTYKKAQRTRELAKQVPLDRLMLETDAPFLSPEGSRGTRNEPQAVQMLARELARIKEIDVGAIAAVTTANAKTFFNMP